MASRMGRRPKGDRLQTTLRVPRTHMEVYRQRAEEAGLPLSDYLAVCLAAGHDLGEQELGYIKPKRQEELPIGA